ncbi:MAG TPA: YchE family NAAT transporter [Gammaproteobacteria bacterium]|nr:YchE family NAAT transporter [Gammaproteobacteria bacterium]
MLDFTEYTKILLGLIAILNPIGAIPIFVTLMRGETDRRRNTIARTVVVTVCLILLAALFFGQILLDFFGITVGSFRVGGGILILLMAISMMQARRSPVVQTQAEAQESESKEQVAVVPLSMPLLAGPGAISTVIVYSHRGTDLMHYVCVGLIIVIVSLLLWMILKSVPWLSRHMSQTGINIFTRIMGLILAAIAVEFIANGLKGLFPVLAGSG